MNIFIDVYFCKTFEHDRRHLGFAGKLWRGTELIHQEY